MTYPAITQIRKSKQTGAVVVRGDDVSHEQAIEIWGSLGDGNSSIIKREKVVRGDNPWLLGSLDEIELVRGIEARFPLLEEVGCRVFIGAATGANDIYIVNPEQVQIEPCRLLDVVTARELKNGRIEWKGQSLINTYDDDGLIELSSFPRLEAYFNMHRERLLGRHVAENNPKSWYKTIDRVHECRARSEKLLIPDIGDDPIVVYDAGQYHPNNSIYYICSTEWHLQALRVVLLSRIGKLFIATYSTKIAKGYLRYQAQYLRRICLPRWQDITPDLRNRLIEAGQHDDSTEYTSLSCELYGLTQSEISTLGV
jgi:hypothetical protein